MTKKKMLKKLDALVRAYKEKKKTPKKRKKMKVFKFYAETLVLSETEEEARESFMKDSAIYFCENANCKEIDNPDEYGFYSNTSIKPKKKGDKNESV